MQTHTVTDLALSAFLSLKGHQLVKIEGERGRTLFVFEDSVSLNKDTLTFFNRRARVEPLAFAETLRNFKALTRRGDKVLR